ncbi:hypothetical protein [Streptomyces sp. WAC01280]|uniref:hypothetical protein n=1 Tax=Streptomyces sp. WAC01280 TaxID=2487424 RepID=UPI000F77D222|nr:hypothetical protein [Streptomyces sp. WAC01280]RSS59555.1 hypothetical protein EF909_06670 [Streptomyces sp. WAC01280]
MTGPTPIPDAATAVIRAVLEDEGLGDLLYRPERTAQRVTKALEKAGWDLRVIPPTITPENGT